MTDIELLNLHRDGSDSAFADLVRRHLAWVYGLACRRLGDSHLADDVAQAVFVLLHRKSPQFTSDRAMMSWLYKTARYASDSAARGERRRLHRESKVATSRPEATQPAETPEWQELAPMLDQLIGRLSRADREAILLRYYRDLSFTEVAEQIGATPEAARKRVERAVEKLRQMTAGKGSPISLASLTAGLATFIRIPPPPGLIATATTVATAPAGSAMAASTAGIVKGTLNMMTNTKITIVSLTALAILLVGCLIYGAVWMVADAQTATNAPAPLPAPAPSDNPAISDRITVTVRGQGPDVVLIPGLATSGAVWDATAARLEGRYRLHIVQVAGFGGSPARANAQGPIIQPTVDALDAYIKTNNLKAPKVIGHSLGGLMGLILAVQHPEDVGSLMIVDSLPFYSVLIGANDVAAATPQAAAMRDNLLDETQDAYINGEKDFIPSLVKSPEGRTAVTKWAIASDKSVVARALYEDMTTDLRPRLPQIKTQVTMLYPFDRSAGLPQAAVDGLYQESFAPLPNKTIVRIDGSFEFIMLDQPDVFAAQVDAFLK